MGKFSELLDWSRFSVQKAPGYVFLCGASLECEETSLRAQFYNQKVKNNSELQSKIQLAEDANRWYRSSRNFADLLELEECLAGLSSCILLFVESPGAIAELGAFTQMQGLRDKLIVVLERFYADGPSFIVDGPIEQMKKYNKDSVRVYPWMQRDSEKLSGKMNEELLRDTLDSISEDLQAKLQKVAQKNAFREDDLGHKLLLLADLINLLVITNQQELQTIIEELKIDFKEKKISKYLYLLCQVGIVSKETYRSVDYYFNDANHEYILYFPKTPMDRQRLREVIRADFPVNDDKRKALKAHQTQQQRRQ